MEGSSLFSKEKLNNEDVITIMTNVIGLNKDSILIIENNEDWIKRDDNISFIIEYNGLLDGEDTDDYIGYHYYDLWYEDIKMEEKLKALEKEFKTKVIIDME